MNQKQTHSVLDTNLFQNYASPHYCSELMYAGFCLQAEFFWRVFPDGESLLDTYNFDIDGYYKDGMEMLQKLRPAKILPAYSIKELENRLPDYCVCRVNREYTLSIDDNYRIGPVTALRLPDALAMMTLAILQKNRVHES